MLLLLGAFIAGVLTVLAPCVLPLLPVIIGGSITGDEQDRRRPVIIAVSLAISLFVFTLLLKATALLINIPPNVITYISGGIIIALGLAMLFPITYAKLIARTGIEVRAQRLLGSSNQDRRRYVGPILTGAALGPVFSSCSPVYAYILATVLPAHFADALAYVISYIIGLALILLAISYYGRRLTTRLKFIYNPTGYFQRGLAVVFILVGIAIVSGTGTKIQVYVADHTPFNFDNFSAGLIPKTKTQAEAASSSSLYNVTAFPAPDFTGIQGWINSKPLTMSQLKGKVVLVDFWTYTCINCIRTLPYLEGWYSQYQKDGLVIVGVEAPEFSYEKIPSNVAAAAKQDGIKYPIAIDGNLDTWNAYQNQYWPADYLIDRNGNVRREAFGEGDYSATEQAIRGLLQENSSTKLSNNLVATGNIPVPISPDQTPETYLGIDRASGYEGSPSLGASPDQQYQFTNSLDQNAWSLSGEWIESGSSITAGKNAKIEINVAAKNVYVVGGASKASTITVKFNGQPISQAGDAGANVKNSQFTMQLSNLYRIANFSQFTSGTIELDVPSGVSLNTFTFGD
jgi:cytochrome c biogenesis protein CcdA/thiol-disulfide isomerase/thioredoxin